MERSPSRCAGRQGLGRPGGSGIRQLRGTTGAKFKNQREQRIRIIFLFLISFVCRRIRSAVRCTPPCRDANTSQGVAGLADRQPHAESATTEQVGATRGRSVEHIDGSHDQRRKCRGVQCIVLPLIRMLCDGRLCLIRNLSAARAGANLPMPNDRSPERVPANTSRAIECRTGQGEFRWMGPGARQSMRPVPAQEWERAFFLVRRGFTAGGPTHISSMGRS